MLAGCSHNVPAPVVNLSDFKSPTFPNPALDDTLPEYHEVLLGDTLFSIAWRYGVDFRELAEINDIENDFRIYPGQKLRFAAQQIPLKSQDFDPNKLQRAVRLALGVPPDTNRVPAPSTNEALKQSERSPKVAQVTTHKSTSSQKRLKSTRQEPIKSVKGQVTLHKVNRWFWPTKGRIIEEFSRELHGNKGVDIEGRLGQPVRAAAPGRVVYSGNALKGYGNLVIVKHNNDYLSAYAHNSKIHVQENEIVKAGQVIADIGNTGTDKNKLHFEIRYQGKPVDPMKYLPKL